MILGILIEGMIICSGIYVLGLSVAHPEKFSSHIPRWGVKLCAIVMIFCGIFSMIMDILQHIHK